MAKKTPRFSKNPGMMMVISYLDLLIVNVIVLWLATQWFPQYIVLGTISLTAGWALCLSMSKLALIGTFAMPFFNEWEAKKGKKLADKDWMIGYFVINFVGLWLITRMSAVFGLGVTSWTVVAGLAIAMDAAQGFAMMQLEKWRTN